MEYNLNANYLIYTLRAIYYNELKLRGHVPPAGLKYVLTRVFKLLTKLFEKNFCDVLKTFICNNL